jgi:hypothetical protein
LVYKKQEAKLENCKHLSKEPQTSKSNDHKQIVHHYFSKTIPKLHLYYNILPKKANPIGSKNPTIVLSKPKAMQNVCL